VVEFEAAKYFSRMKLGKLILSCGNMKKAEEAVEGVEVVFLR